jgi:hypothetical protein
MAASIYIGTINSYKALLDSLLAELLMEFSKATLEHVYFGVEELRPAAHVACSVGLAHGLIKVRPAALRKLAVEDEQIVGHLVPHIFNVLEEEVRD